MKALLRARTELKNAPEAHFLFGILKSMKNWIMTGGVVFVAIVAGVFLFLYSTSVSSNQSSTVISVPFTKLAQGTQSTVSVRTNYLITSTGEFEKLWKMIDAKGSPPTVDFTKNSVAAIFAGTVSSVEDTDVRTVTVTGTSCSFKKATTTPYELITLPATPLEFTHEDQATNNCL